MGIQPQVCVLGKIMGGVLGSKALKNINHSTKAFKFYLSNCLHTMILDTRRCTAPVHMQGLLYTGLVYAVELLVCGL